MALKPLHNMCRGLPLELQEQRQKGATGAGPLSRPHLSGVINHQIANRNSIN